MANFVLVIGAWEAGCAWKWVSPLLHEAGHNVFTSSLTGLDEWLSVLDIR